jgi:GNAT superfamily N-acetyltransferase
MNLRDGYTDLPPGKIASVVTYLEMRERPRLLPVKPPAGLSFRRVVKPDLDWYRKLYRTVGEEWLWFSRLRMNDTELAAILHDPQVELYALSSHGEDKGLLELDCRTSPDVEIASFGLSADLVGQGAGRYLMACALEAAWTHSPQRVWLHTCTLDSARALSFYIKAGFVPYKRAIEVSDDPRLTGEIPKSAAPQVPLIGG